MMKLNKNFGKQSSNQGSDAGSNDGSKPVRKTVSGSASASGSAASGGTASTTGSNLAKAASPEEKRARAEANEVNRLANLAKRERDDAKRATMAKRELVDAKRPPSATPASRSSSMSRALPKGEPTVRSASSERVKNDFSSIASVSGGGDFAKFRSAFSTKFVDGHPNLAMFYALNQMSIKYCGVPDERCAAVLDAELKRLCSGTKRSTSDDMTLFSRFVTILNSSKSPFAGMDFDSDFFLKCNKGLHNFIVTKGSIRGLEIDSAADKVRVNITGKKDSKAHWDSTSTFVMNLIGNEDYLTVRNLPGHLSSTHIVTDKAVEVMSTVKDTSSYSQIRALFNKTKILPEVLQHAIVYRALGDNGELVQDERAGVYEIRGNSQLAKILSSLKAPFITVDKDKVSVPFGNVSSLITLLFTPNKDEKGTYIRTIIEPKNFEYVHLAIAFRYESKMLSKLRSEEKKKLM